VLVLVAPAAGIFHLMIWPVSAAMLVSALVVLPYAGQAKWSALQMAISTDRLGLTCITAKPLLRSVWLEVDDMMSFDPIAWQQPHAVSFGQGEPWIWSYRAEDWAQLTAAHPQFTSLRAEGCQTTAP
jgi:hypothetical protein